VPRPKLVLVLGAAALLAAGAAAGTSAAQPFASSSVWRAPVSSGASLTSDSGALVRNLVGQVATYGAWINTWQYSVPVYTVPATQPAVHVTLDTSMPALQADFDAVPIPPGAKPAPGTDAHLTVYQPATDTLWEFWKAASKADGWHARWGGKMRDVSTNPGYFPSPFGATATSLPLLGGLMRAGELQAGSIPHALALALPETRAGSWVWPAQRTDGKSTAVDAIPQGTHFRLDPAVDVGSLGLTPAGRVIALAAQRYGLVVRDTSGSVSLYAEDPAPLGSNPYPAIFGGKTAAQVLSGFPWNRLQAVAPPSTLAGAARR
jgi:hypothetical protein